MERWAAAVRAGTAVVATGFFVLALLALFALGAGRAGATRDPAGAGASSVVGGARPLWPLEERTCVTGSFGEHRVGHLHAGIDLSTNGSTGLPVRAPLDGRVVRLRASPYGYGRAIYIDTLAGTQIVYAHLSDFAPPWRERIEAEQERRGAFTVDIAVSDSPRVAAGEVVAFTGDTGAGPAHLHFEVRRGDATPINPFIAGWDLPRQGPPIIEALRFVPLGIDGRVDRGFDAVVVPVTRAAQGGPYRAAREVAIGGAVGVHVKARERGDGCAASRGIHSASLSVGEHAIYTTTFDEFSYDREFNRVYERYDYEAMRDGLGRFVRLFDPVSREARGSLRPEILFGDGRDEVTITVIVADARGEAARAEILVARERGAVAGEQERGSTRRTGSGKRDKPGATASWRLAPQGLVVRVAGASPEQLDESASLSRSGRDGDVVWYSAPRERLLDRDAGPVVIEWNAAPDERGKRLIDLGAFVWGEPGATCEIRAAGSASRPVAAAARVIAGAGALRAPALFTGSGEPVTPRPPAGLLPRAPAARFDPPDPFVDEPLDVRFAIPDSLAAHHRRLAIYSVAASGAISALGGSLDEETGELVARSRTLGTFVLIEDRSAPRLSRPRPAEGRATTAIQPRLSVAVSEVGAGLDDESVRFAIDGEPLIAEYDPDAGILKARPRGALANGSHRVEVTVSDKAGNTDRLWWDFVVQPQKKGSRRR